MSDFPESTEPCWRGECVVMKFGGTSVEDAAAIVRVTGLVKRRLRHRPVVVVSALANVTDQLLGAAQAAAHGNMKSADDALCSLRARHEAIAREVVPTESLPQFRAELSDAFNLLHTLKDQIATEGRLLPHVQDHFLGMGEIVSSKMLAAALLPAGIPAAWVDPKQCIITDAGFTRATPLWDQTNQSLRNLLLPMLLSGRVPVTGGFVAATAEGIPTTVGRQGSDYSAAIIGAGLRADRIEIWTDVDGVMSTDPNLCPDARRVTTMSFDEAADLAFFGAKVLHPATLEPAIRRNIPVWVLNSRNPQSGGTEIIAQTAEGGRVKAITAKRGIAVVDVQPLRGIGFGAALRDVFDAFERHHYSLDLLSASRGCLSVLVSSTSALPKVAAELQHVASVRWENHKALVCLVGERIRRHPQIASQVLHAVSDLETRLICQGASDRNIGFLVDESRADEAVRRIHELLFSRRGRRMRSSPASALAAGSYN